MMGVLESYELFYEELKEFCDELGIPLYVFRSDMVFKEFPCIAVGPVGYNNDKNYFADQVLVRKRGGLYGYDVGLTIKTKDDYEYNDKSGIELLMYLVEIFRKFFKGIRRRKEYFQTMNAPITVPIIFNTESQTFEINILIRVGVIAGE